MSTSFAIVGLGAGSLILAVAALIMGHREARHTQTSVTLAYGGKVLTFAGAPGTTPKETLQQAYKYIMREECRLSSSLPVQGSTDKNQAQASSPATNTSAVDTTIPAPAEPETSEGAESGSLKHSITSKGQAISKSPSESLSSPDSTLGVDLTAVVDPSTESAETRAPVRQDQTVRKRPRGSAATSYLPDERDMRNSEVHDDSYVQANLRRVDFSGSDLDHASFAGSDLSYAIMDECSLVDADLSDANLRYSHLVSVNFLRANLRGANLDGADLQRSNLAGADLREASLQEANFRLDDLAGAQWDETTVWSEEVRTRLYEASTQVVHESGATVFEVDSNPEEEVMGASIRRH